MAQAVKHPTLDFGWGHDLGGPEIKSHVRFRAQQESAGDSLPAPHPACVPACSLSLLLSNK